MNKFLDYNILIFILAAILMLPDISCRKIQDEGSSNHDATVQDFENTEEIFDPNFEICCLNNELHAIISDFIPGFQTENPELEVSSRKLLRENPSAELISTDCDIIIAGHFPVYEEAELIVSADKNYREIPIFSRPLIPVVRVENQVQAITEDDLRKIAVGEIIYWNEISGSGRKVDFFGPHADTERYKFLFNNYWNGMDTLVYRYITSDNLLLKYLYEYDRAVNYGTEPIGIISIKSWQEAENLSNLKVLPVEKDGAVFYADLLAAENPDSSLYPFSEPVVVYYLLPENSNIASLIELITDESNIQIWKDAGYQRY